MNILIISGLPPIKYPEADHAYHIATHFADRGHEVHLLAQQGALVPDCPGLTVHQLMHHWSWAELPRLALFLRRFSPDVILLNYVGHLYNRHPMITFASAVAKVIKPRIPFVTQIEYPLGAAVGPEAGWLRRSLHKAVRTCCGKGADYQFGTLLRDSERVVVLSGAHATILEQFCPGLTDKALLIPPAVIMPLALDDPQSVRNRERERLGVAAGEQLLTYFGYIYPGKGIETLLQAFARICRERADVRLMIVGGTPASDTGYVQQIHDMPQKLNIADRVVFTGGFDWQSDQASRYLRASDIAVLPFDLGVQLNNSSFAAVVSHGLPTITTQAEEVEALFVHGDNVYFCRPRNSEAMADAISMVLDHPDLRQRLHAGALKLADEWFGWDRAMERLTSAFRGVEEGSSVPLSIAGTCDTSLNA